MNKWANCIARVLVVVVWVLVAPACTSTGDLGTFPGERVAETSGYIDADSLRPAFRGGRLLQIVSAGPDSFYLTTADPAQVLRVGLDGKVRWASDGSDSGSGPFVGTWLRLSLSPDGGALVADGGSNRILRVSSEGKVIGDVALTAAFAAADGSDGNVFVYPNTEGFLLDVFDVGLRYSRSVVPLPGTPNQVAPTSCLLLDDPQGGVIALWNPTRTVFAIGLDGKRRREFAVTPPDLLADLTQRTEKVQAAAKAQGRMGFVNPFIDFVRDPQGRLGALYLFEGALSASADASTPTGRRNAALYRFTSDGRPVDVIRGLGDLAGVAFLGEELLGVDAVDNRIVRFRVK